jgi:hypothetical protein
MKVAVALSLLLVVIIGTMLQHDAQAGVERLSLTPLPYVTLCLLPLYLWLVQQLWSYRVKLPWLLKPFLFLLCTALVMFGFIHCFVTWAYGNLNNEAWTDSWMVDVIAPPDYFQWTEMQNFQVAEDPAKWLSAVKAPHLPTSMPNCGPRMFVRFMAHRFLPTSRLAKVLNTDGLMFIGSWVMATGVDFRQHIPKLFTEMAGGNDIKFNKLVLRPFMVDMNNIYVDFNKTLDDAHSQWDISGSDGRELHMHGTGKFFEDKTFLMDQYSCMVENALLEKFINKRWCFYKTMEAASVEEVEGTLEWPKFKGQLHFPSGSLDDCSKPYVRAIYANNLHWLRETYSC